MSKEIPIKNNRIRMADYVLEALKEHPDSMQERKRNVCSKCRYSVRSANVTGKSALTQIRCNYIEDTGHMRGCSPVNCQRFEPKTDEDRKKPNNSIKYDNGVRIR